MSYLHGYDHPLDDRGVIHAVMAEYDRAKVKHGENTLDGSLSNDLLRLAALVEEVGEVAHELTYDRVNVLITTVHGDESVTQDAKQRLKKELVQVAAVACTWASIL